MELLNKRTKYDYFEKISNIYGFFIIVLFPLLYGPKGYADITEAKWNIFRVTAYLYLLVSFVTLLYCLFSGSRHIFKERASQVPFRISISQILVLIFIIWNLVSAVLSPYGFKKCMLGFGRFEGWLSALLYGAVFICLSFWGEFHSYYVKSLSVAVLLFCFIGFLQFFKDGIIYPRGYTFWNARFLSTLGNADMVGGYVSFAMPILLVFYVLYDSKKWNYVVLAAIGFLSFVFDMANVDSGRMGLLVSLVCCLIFMVDTADHLIRFLKGMGAFVVGLFLSKWFGLTKEGFSFVFGLKTAILFLGAAALFGLSFILKNAGFKYKKSAREAQKIGLIVLLVCIALGLIFVYFYKGNVVLIKEASEALHLKMGDNAGSGRGYIWKTASKLALKRFWFGYGPGSFGDVYSSYDVLPTYTDFAHNDFIQIAMCTGYASLIVYVFFCFFVIARAFKYQESNKALLVLVAGIFSYLVHSFFSFSIAIIQPLFWVGAGILDCQIRYTELYEKGRSKTLKKGSLGVISLW